MNQNRKVIDKRASLLMRAWLGVFCQGPDAESALATLTESIKAVYSCMVQVW